MEWRRFSTVPVGLPEKEIMMRLGANRHLTVIEPATRRKIEDLIRRAFALCHPRGLWRCCAVTAARPDAVELAAGAVYRSTALARLLQGCSAVWTAASTIGTELPAAAAERMAAGDGLAAMVYDAVGSETADAAMDWLQQCAGRELRRRGLTLTSRRFSPGYGDLDLSQQRTIFTLLELERWGLKLSETCIMTPEKSVTAIAGVGAINEESIA